MIAAFTAHNIRWPDGTCSIPDNQALLRDGPRLSAVRRTLKLLYPGSLHGKRILDLGCLEGGYALEFAQLGMQSVGLEARQANYENCMRVKAAFRLPNLDFVRDDAWNLGKYGYFDVIFCWGLLYHIDRPRTFVELMGRHAHKALIVGTHFAADAKNPNFSLGPIAEHDGCRGRWTSEFETDDPVEIENLRWASWGNKQSFWLMKPDLLQSIRDAGFDLVFEQMDFLGADIRSEMTGGYYTHNDRGMFVGIRL